MHKLAAEHSRPPQPLRFVTASRLALAGVWLLFVLLVTQANQLSLTADEPAYIASGYGLLARGRQVFPVLIQRGFTPLLIALEAWPFYSANPNLPLDQFAGWPADYAEYTKSFELAVPSLAPDRLLARLPIIFLSLILSAVVFRWGRAIWGAAAGLLALGVLLFDPLLLAHGGLANSDAGAVALGTAALYVTWRWMKRPGWRFALTAGVLLGLTMLAKVSGLIWAAAAGLMIVATLAGARKGWRTLLVQGMALTGLTVLVLWAGYGFQWGPVGNLSWPVPAPAYWASLFFLNKYSDFYFALGLHQQGGWWWYFPVAFLIKNPLPLLIALVISLITLLRRPALRPNLLALGVFPLLYTVIAIWDGLNIGYRFMLPVHPLLYLVIGGGLASWAFGQPGAARRWWALGAVAALGAWYVFGTARIFPYEISFFNEWVGGPDQGYRYLADSNVDWGQAFDVQQRYLRDHPEVQSQPPAARYDPAPGRYLVGASPLQGAGISDPNAYEWFRHRQPQAILSHSLLVYDVPAGPLNWLAQCDQPAPPLDSAAIAQGTGSPDLRSLTFDCSKAWIYPGGESSPGIYAFHHAQFTAARLCPLSLLACPPAPIDAFVARHLAGAQLSYEQAINGRLPAFVLYETVSAAAPLLPPTSVQAVSVAALPAGANAPVLQAPVPLDGPLAFLGAVAYLTGQSIDIETWWQVTSHPINAPFSIMAHLLAADGTTHQVADGLGVPPTVLVAGDIVVQRHRFSKPTAAGDISLLIGAYWLNALAPWNVSGAPGTDALMVHLAVPR